MRLRFQAPVTSKGVSKASQVQVGDLGLEVLATQSGGVALNANDDVAALLQKCVADTAAYYELPFDPPQATGETNTIT
jgi:hypothetical protein